MGDEGQSVHLLAVEQQIHLHQIAGMVALDFIIQRGVTPGVGLQRVKKIIDDLVQRHQIVQFHQIGIQILHIFEFPSTLLAHGHDIAHIIRRGDDGNLGIGLQRLGNRAWVGVIVRIVHMDHRAVGFGDLIDDGRQCGH